MYRPEETQENLEFNKILELVSTKCVSELGKARLLNTTMFIEKDQLENSLHEVDETKEIYIVEAGLPLWPFHDMRISLHKIEPLESYLEPVDCQEVQSFLELAAETIKFFNKFGEKYPHLNNLSSNLNPLNNILKLIQGTIEPSGTIYDNASPELKKIRTEIDHISKQIHIKLERIARKQSDHLQEDYITLREERLVLPVREYSVNKIPGIVHGQSSTGQTHYVEPMAVVPLNNEMQELYSLEKKEIIKILKRISNTIREHGSEILINLDILTHFDVLQAKAQFSISNNSTAPIINEEFTWEINEGYHPLLLKLIGEKTSPLSLKIGEDFRIMIITGPNAGGKTVALKTIGLLQLLFQSGFHIPVKEGSKFPICKNIFTVIGDEQSIENDLSTFSSHITKLNEIVQKCDHSSLILIDEIGTGTDPSEGSALAIALLENLNNDGLVTMVTTHHSELKAFAHTMDNVINAAMQFDNKTLTPLFLLETGIPGSSYAFDISKRLGVDDGILNRAQELIGTKNYDLDKMILELSETKHMFDCKISELKIKETELEGLQSLYHTRADDLKKNKKNYEKEAQKEAKDILNTVNKTIESVVREIRESKAQPEIIKKSRKIIDNLKENIISGEIAKSLPQISIDNISEGMHVSSKRFSLSGVVSKVNKDKNEIEIESKGVKILVPLDDIECVQHNNSDQTREYSHSIDNSNVLNEIDVRGRIAEDAIVELERYLDLALQSEWKELRIIHGKGTGALRKAIHKYLRANKRIKSFRLGGFGEGDTGVTVITIK